MLRASGDWVRKRCSPGASTSSRCSTEASVSPGRMRVSLIYGAALSVALTLTSVGSSDSTLWIWRCGGSSVRSGCCTMPSAAAPANRPMAVTRRVRRIRPGRRDDEDAERGANRAAILLRVPAGLSEPRFIVRDLSDGTLWTQDAGAGCRLPLACVTARGRACAPATHRVNNWYVTKTATVTATVAYD